MSLKQWRIVARSLFSVLIDVFGYVMRSFNAVLLECQFSKQMKEKCCLNETMQEVTEWYCFTVVLPANSPFSRKLLKYFYLIKYVLQ